MLKAYQEKPVVVQNRIDFEITIILEFYPTLKFLTKTRI